MARIRSIKPEFFQHEAIFEAEKKHRLPLRLAYIGLWTQADRRGLFRWRPNELKLNVMPWDSCDFGKVLDALRSEGFVTLYEVDGHKYGLIPTFSKHQVFNVREKPSVNIPAAPMSVPTPCQNGTSTVPVPSGSGRDREGKGRDRERKGSAEGEPDAAPRLGSHGAASAPREPKADPEAHRARVVASLLAAQPTEPPKRQPTGTPSPDTRGHPEPGVA